MIVAVEAVEELKHQPLIATTSQSRVAPRVTLGGSGAALVVEDALAEATALVVKVPVVRTMQQVRTVVPSLEV